MKKKGLLIICLVIPLVFSLVVACTPSAPAPAPAPVPTNSESDSRIAELEAKIRQLEAENQRFLAENQQLSSNLAKATAVLQNLQNLVISSNYTLALDRLTEVQSDTSELANYAEGLPPPPPLPPGLTVSQINDAINKARHLREILAGLPPLPPPGWPPFLPFPPELVELEAYRQVFINMTVWMEDLEDLPAFLAAAGSLKDLKSRVKNYLADVHNTTSFAGDMMRQVRDSTSGY